MSEERLREAACSTTGIPIEIRTQNLISVE